MPSQSARLIRPRNWAWWGVRSIGAVAGLILVLAAVGAVYESVSSARDLRRFPPPGQMIDVGGYRLHLLCEGVGNPTVVMDAGLGDSWLTWSTIQPVIARTSQVCAYDRAGLGYSDPGPEQRESARIVAELHAVLTNAHLAPPYVLVGHSFGGLNTRLFTYTYPSEVAALVLVDPSHEDLLSSGYPASFRLEDDRALSHMGRQATRAIFGLQRLTRTSAADMMAAPPSERTLLATLGYRREWYRAQYAEYLAFGTSTAQLRSARRSLVIPLYVLDGRYKPEELGPGDLQSDTDLFFATWHRLHRELAGTSTDGHLIIAARSNHYVQFDQPELVVQAITDALVAVRKAR